MISANVATLLCKGRSWQTLIHFWAFFCLPVTLLARVCNKKKECRPGALTGRFSNRLLQIPSRFTQRVLRLVEFRNRLDEIQPCACQVLLRLDVFQHDSYRKFFALLSQAQAFFGRIQGPFRRCELITR